MSEFVELVRLEQTLFALPFAYTGMLLAGPGLPTWQQFGLISLAMFGARTAGMGANRLIDMEIDRHNPRTAGRALPAGRLRPATVAFLTVCAFSLLVWAAFQLNPLCGRLSPLAILLLLGYSYTKRFTWGCHLALGLVQACAPIGGWLAVAGHFAPTPLWLGLAIGLWVGGFDVLYACQDLAHDRSVGLHSIPARVGARNAFRISRVMHGLALSALALAGTSAGLGLPYFVGLGLIGSLLVWEHQLLSPEDLSRLQQAFFQANAMISVTLLLAVLIEVLR